MRCKGEGVNCDREDSPPPSPSAYCEGEGSSERFVQRLCVCARARLFVSRETFLIFVIRINYCQEADCDPTTLRRFLVAPN